MVEIAGQHVLWHIMVLYYSALKETQVHNLNIMICNLVSSSEVV